MDTASLSRWGGIAAITGGVLWAVTPLRDAVFGGGANPGDAAFRPYNLAILIIAALLIGGLAAFYARYGDRIKRSGVVGSLLVLVGYALLFFGSALAVLVSGDRFGDIVRVGQDLGFLGAVIAAIGAILLGLALRHNPDVPRSAVLLLIASFPAGLLGVIVISALGAESIAGLPLTALYGAAWYVLGHHLSFEQRAPAAA